MKCQSLQKTSARQPWGRETGGKGFLNKAYLNVRVEMNGCPPCLLAYIGVPVSRRQRKNSPSEISELSNDVNL